MCDGDGETHKIVFRRTSVSWDKDKIKAAGFPHGIENPSWITQDPRLIKLENRAGTEISITPDEIDMDDIESSDYYLIDIDYTTIREMTYDYGERNFRVREMDGSIYYTRYPEPEKKGLFRKLRSIF